MDTLMILCLSLLEIAPIWERPVLPLPHIEILRLERRRKKAVLMPEVQLSTLMSVFLLTRNWSYAYVCLQDFHLPIKTSVLGERL